MSITCQVCGTINPDDAEFCEGCGVELSAPEPAPSARAPQTEDAVAEDAAAADTSAASEPAPPLADAEAKPPEPTPPLADAEAKPPEPSSPAASQVPPPATEPPAPDPAPSPTTDTATDTAADTATDTATGPTVGIDKPDLGEPQLPAETSTSPAPASTPASTPQRSEEEPPPTSPDTAPTPAKLHIKRYGAVTDDTIPLQGERLVVGRFDPSTGPVDIDVSGMSGAEHISRRHAELVFEDGRWKVRDLGSTNGVFVKRAQESSYSPRIQEPTPLSDGDEIAFGNVVFVFRQGA
ncbi:MAG: FHA domain-containing protein [Trueperaceae bacterium]|nr:FHA domain-containing protein [Trueperaceae bacterium]